MLYIYFGDDPKSKRGVSGYFKYNYERKWFDDPLVREMVFDIDKSKVIAGTAIDSPVLGVVSPLELSGGVKTCILLLKEDNFYPNLINCGENCAKWIAKIAEMRDIKASLSGIDLLFENCDINAICLNDNSRITNSKEWGLKMLEFAIKRS